MASAISGRRSWPLWMAVATSWPDQSPWKLTICALCMGSMMTDTLAAVAPIGIVAGVSGAREEV